MKPFVTASVITSLAGVSILVAAIYISRTSTLISNVPVHVNVGASSLCVGRQFFDEEQLRHIEAGTTYSGYPYNRVYLSLFTQELTGFTAETYRAARELGSHEYLPGWIRVMIWPGDVPEAFRVEVGSVIKEYYEPNSTLDSGFR